MPLEQHKAPYCSSEVAQSTGRRSEVTPKERLLSQNRPQSTRKHSKVYISEHSVSEHSDL